MTCADLEILLCDYLDGALDAAGKAKVEAHLADCPACTELAQDAGRAIAFIGRAADVEPPPELLTRILFDPPWSRKQTPAAGLRKWFHHLVHSVLQPRFAMG